MTSPGLPAAAPPQAMTLFGYWRSSAAYRVRLALAYKRLEYNTIDIDLRSGMQSAANYTAANPQGLVPMLQFGDTQLVQSLAIIEYIDEVYPAPPLLPGDALGRARVRSAAQIITADIHPLNNLRVLKYLKDPLEQPQDSIDRWARHWITGGLEALEAFATRYGGRFLYGDHLTLADLCLVPQLYNARRVNTDLLKFPRICAIDTVVNAEDFSHAAQPERHRMRIER